MKTTFNPFFYGCIILLLIIIILSGFFVPMVKKDLSRRSVESLGKYEYQFGDTVFREGTGEEYLLFIGRYSCVHCSDFFKDSFLKAAETLDATIVYRSTYGQSQEERLAISYTACAPEFVRPSVVKHFYLNPGSLKFLLNDLPLSVALTDNEVIEMHQCASKSAETLLAGFAADKLRYDIIGTPTIVSLNGVLTGNHNLEDIALER